MDMFLAKTYNKAFKNKINVFVYLSILSVIFTLILYPITKEFLEFLIYLLVIAFILAITTVRLSPVVVYSKITKHLSMNLKDLNYGHNFDYDIEEDRYELSLLFRKDFINGIKYAHKKGYRTIRMTTHKWVIENIVKDEEINKLYEIKITENGECDTKLETLLLAGKDTKRKNFKKKSYKVLLKRI